MFPFVIFNFTIIQLFKEFGRSEYFNLLTSLFGFHSLCLNNICNEIWEFNILCTQIVNHSID